MKFWMSPTTRALIKCRLSFLCVNIRFSPMRIATIKSPPAVPTTASTSPLKKAHNCTRMTRKVQCIPAAHLFGPVLCNILSSPAGAHQPPQTVRRAQADAAASAGTLGLAQTAWHRYMYIYIYTHSLRPSLSCRCSFVNTYIQPLAALRPPETHYFFHDAKLRPRPLSPRR